MAGVRLNKTERSDFKKKLKKLSSDRNIKVSISDFYRKCTLALTDEESATKLLEVIKL